MAISPESPYSPQVRDHILRPRNVGPLDDANGVGHDENPVCGDVMTVWVRIRNGLIEAATFTARGCDPAIASGSRVTEMIVGRRDYEAVAIAPEDVADALGGLPPVKRHCAVLAVRSMRKAIADHRDRQMTPQPDTIERPLSSPTS
jgi:nitrogen fixation NifU-like protein